MPGHSTLLEWAQHPKPKQKFIKYQHSTEPGKHIQVHNAEKSTYTVQCITGKFKKDQHSWVYALSHEWILSLNWRYVCVTLLLVNIFTRMFWEPISSPTRSFFTCMDTSTLTCHTECGANKIVNFVLISKAIMCMDSKVFNYCSKIHLASETSICTEVFEILILLQIFCTYSIFQFLVL